MAACTGGVMVKRVLFFPFLKKGGTFFFPQRQICHKDD